MDDYAIRNLQESKNNIARIKLLAKDLKKVANVIEDYVNEEQWAKLTPDEQYIVKTNIEASWRAILAGEQMLMVACGTARQMYQCNKVDE